MRPPSPSRRWFAPLLDLACLVGFVSGGKQEHGLDGGIGWYLEVVWPFALAFAVGAVVTRLYWRDDRPWARLAGTLVVTMIGALTLRSVVYAHALITTFVIVASCFLVATTAGWRLVVLAVGRARRGRSTSPEPQRAGLSQP